MGKLTNGAFGGFSGKVGNIVGSKWRNMDLIRSLPRKSNKPKSVAQLAQQQKMPVASKFLMGAKGIINAYFGKPKNGNRQMNAAVSYHMKSAITGNYPNQQINFEKVLFTYGGLLNVQQIEMAQQPGHKLLFSWTDNSGLGNADPEDSVIIIVCHETSAVIAYDNTAIRSDTGLEFHVPASWPGKVHCWFGLWSDKKKEAATNIYLGSFEW